MSDMYATDLETLYDVIQKPGGLTSRVRLEQLVSDLRDVTGFVPETVVDRSATTIGPIGAAILSLAVLGCSPTDRPSSVIDAGGEAEASTVPDASPAASLDRDGGLCENGLNPECQPGSGRPFDAGGVKQQVRQRLTLPGTSSAGWPCLERDTVRP